METRHIRTYLVGGGADAEDEARGEVAAGDRRRRRRHDRRQRQEEEVEESCSTRTTRARHRRAVLVADVEELYNAHLLHLRSLLQCHVGQAVVEAPRAEQRRHA
jgi:hypothetical protein